MPPAYPFDFLLKFSVFVVGIWFGYGGAVVYSSVYYQLTYRTT